jgi:hypothetical protein
VVDRMIAYSYRCQGSQFVSVKDAKDDGYVVFENGRGCFGWRQLKLESIWQTESSFVLGRDLLAGSNLRHNSKSLNECILVVCRFVLANQHVSLLVIGLRSGGCTVSWLYVAGRFWPSYLGEKSYVVLRLGSTVSSFKPNDRIGTDAGE